MSKIFIFSTRFSFLHYPNDDDYKTKTGKYLFSEDNCEEKQYFDKSYLFEPTIDEKKEIFQWFLNLDETEKEKYKSDFIKDLKFGEEIWQKRAIDKTTDFGPNQKKDIVNLVKSDYYKAVIAKENPDYYCKIKDKDIYAVNPNDKSEEGGKWIECLLANDFVKHGDAVFLLLHDKDIYESNEPFKVLKNEGVNNEVEKYTNVESINILVFQHEKNQATNILRSGNLDNIENDIEAVFYKYPLKKVLLEYIDELFYPSKEGESNVEKKIEAVMTQYDKHPTEYQKMEEFVDFSEEKLSVDELTPGKEKEFYKLIDTLSK